LLIEPSYVFKSITTGYEFAMPWKVSELASELNLQPATFEKAYDTL